MDIPASCDRNQFTSRTVTGKYRYMDTSVAIEVRCSDRFIPLHPASSDGHNAGNPSAAIMTRIPWAGSRRLVKNQGVVLRRRSSAPSAEKAAAISNPGACRVPDAAGAAVITAEETAGLGFLSPAGVAVFITGVADS